MRERETTQSAEKIEIEYDPERARRKRGVWKSSREGTNDKMASVMVSVLEKELSEAISDEANDAHKTPDSA
ncbi:hypothetical protein ACLBW0_02230 [Enterobacteriaceae bacterium C34A]